MACVWLGELLLVAFTVKGSSAFRCCWPNRVAILSDASRSRLTKCYGAVRGHGLFEYRQPDQHLVGDPLPEADRPVLPEPRGLRHRVQGAALRLEDHRGHQVSETGLSCRGKVHRGDRVASWNKLGHAQCYERVQLRLKLNINAWWIVCCLLCYSSVKLQRCEPHPLNSCKEKSRTLITAPGP